MKANYTHLVGVLDASGSVGPIINEMRKSYNSLLDEQAALGETTISTVVFSGKLKWLDAFTPLSQATRLNGDNYQALGTTSLYDAIGTAVRKVGNALNEMDESERPSKVIVYINTDGEENSSREFKLERVKKMIEHQRSKYNWEFIFAGANIDTKKVSQSLGINVNVGYTQTIVGVDNLTRSVSGVIYEMRTGGAK